MVRDIIALSVCLCAWLHLECFTCVCVCACMCTGAVTHGFCLSFTDVVSPALREYIVSKRRRVFSARSETSAGMVSPHVDDSPQYDFVSRKALCILSRWPFSDFFKKYFPIIVVCCLNGPHISFVAFVVPNRFLLDLFVAACSHPPGDGDFTAPESRILFLLNSVPVPDPGSRVDVRVFPDLGYGSQPIFRSPLVTLPPSEASYTPLLTALSPVALTTVMALLLTEQKIVVHAGSGGVAGEVAVILRSLLFPLQWELFFVPVVPINMLGFLGGCHGCMFAMIACE